MGYGCGIALVDLDGDGDDDLVVTGRADGAVEVYENLGTGVFTSRSEITLIDPLLSASAVVAADYDGDGLLDLFFTQWDGPDKLYKNMGEFSFQDVTSMAGVGDTGRGQGAATETSTAMVGWICTW